MLPLTNHPAAMLTPAEEAIARSVQYAALFDYPLTLSQLRQTLIGSAQTASEIATAVSGSRALAPFVEHKDGYYFPAGRSDLVAVRRNREARSRAFLQGHDLLLRLVTMLPFVRLVALSGSIAHLNLERGGDLDLFIVTRGARVWSTAVGVVLLAKLLRRRATVCANFIIADTALAFAQQDLFSASQVIGLRPLHDDDVLRQLLAANPFVRRFYPNFHLAHSNRSRRRRSSRLLRRVIEAALAWPSAIAERFCRSTYRAYLRRRSATWTSPEQVVLGDTVLKLHTRSHRRMVMDRFARATSEGGEGAKA
jgi:hypothetical protein